MAFQGVDAESLSKEEETGTVLMKIAQSLGLFIGETTQVVQDFVSWLVYPFIHQSHNL